MYSLRTMKDRMAYITLCLLILQGCYKGMIWLGKNWISNLEIQKKGTRDEFMFNHYRTRKKLNELSALIAST